MVRSLGVPAVSAVGILLAAAPTRAESLGLLFGVENSSFQLNLEETGSTPSGDYRAYHASSAFAVELSYKENFKARASLGTIASTLEEVDVASSGAEGFICLSVAGAVETSLESGGGLLLDLSYSLGNVKSEEAAGDTEYSHDRTSFIAAYTYGDPGRARFYTGLAYNTYTLEYDGPVDMEFEEKERFNLVVGVRARSETFAGLIEGTLGGEVGLRVSVMFGF